MAELEALKERDPQLWRIYAEGLWGILEGLIYDPFPSTEDWPLWFEETFYGLDFGFNSPSALVEVGVRDNECYATEKLYHTKLTTADIISFLESEQISETAPIYADGASPDCIEEMKRAGYNVIPANKGQGSVNAGISFVRSQTVYTRPENVNLNKELQTYSWAEDKDGILLDEPVKWMDHILDALRYAMHSHLGERCVSPISVGLGSLAPG